MGKRLDLTTILNRFRDVHGDRYDYSEVVLGPNSTFKVKIICKIHGPFLQRPSEHYKNGYGCAKCGPSACRNTRLSRSGISIADITTELKSKGEYYSIDVNSNFQKQEMYLKNDILNIKCSKHDLITPKRVYQIFDIKACVCTLCKRDLRSTLSSRPNYKIRMTFNEFLARAESIFPKDLYEFTRIHKGIFSSTEHIQIFCKKHNIVLTRKARNVIHNKCACTVCNKGMSNPEKRIYKLLESNGIKFEFQKIFPDLNVGKNRYLRYDFYIPSLNLLIEYDGEQHFKPVRIYKSTDEAAISFNRTLDNDRIKNEFAIQKNIFLERIPYTICNLEQYLLNLINDYETRQKNCIGR